MVIIAYSVIGFIVYSNQFNSKTLFKDGDPVSSQPFWVFNKDTYNI